MCSSWYVVGKVLSCLTERVAKCTFVATAGTAQQLCSASVADDLCFQWPNACLQNLDFGHVSYDVLFLWMAAWFMLGR